MRGIFTCENWPAVIHDQLYRLTIFIQAVLLTAASGISGLDKKRCGSIDGVEVKICFQTAFSLLQGGSVFFAKLLKGAAVSVFVT